MYSKYMSGCNEDIHEYLKKELKKANCGFCGGCLVEDEGKRTVCCDDTNIVADDNIRRCTNCFWFEYPYAKEYINFYENKSRIWRKLTYEQRRDYHFFSILRSKSSYFMREEEMSLLRKFNEVIVSFGKTKRCIKFEYIIKPGSH